MTTVFTLLLALQAPVTACPATPTPAPTAAPLTASLVGWDEQAARPTIGKRFTITGRAGIAALSKAAGARPGPGAIVPIMIAAPGTYSVALGGVAWIDVTQGGRLIDSTGHDHGPACSAIRKIVRFALTPGRYELRLSGMSTPTIDILVQRN